MSQQTARRHRFQNRPGRARPRHVRNGAIALAALILLVAIGVNRGIPFWPDNSDRVWAHFASAQSLKSGNPVRVAGVTVGSVGEIEQADGERGALVELKLDKTDVPVHQDARAGIYWRTLLGRNLYVELDPGSESAPPLAGRIPVTNTTTQVELDEVLQPLDGDGRKGMQRIIAATDGGFRGDAAGNAFDALAASAKPIAKGLPPLRGQRPGDDLPRLIQRTSRWVAALDRGKGDLAGLIDNSNTTLRVTAARSAEITQTLDVLPPALDTTRRALVRLRSTLPLLDRVTVDLRPGAERLERAVDLTRPFLREATPVLKDAKVLFTRLDPALRSLRRLAPDATATFEGLRRTIDTTRKQVIPWLQSRNEKMDMKVHELFGPTLSSATGVMATSDANGTFVQFEAGVGESAIPALPCKTLLTDPNDERLAVCQNLGTYLGTLLARPGEQPEFGPEEDQSEDGGG